MSKLGGISKKIFNKEPLTDTEVKTTTEILDKATDENIVEAAKATILSKDQAATGKIEVPKEEVKPVEKIETLSDSDDIKIGNFNLIKDKNKSFGNDKLYFKIEDNTGRELGDIYLFNESDGYRIENIKLNNERTGTGYNLYKELLSKLDKPIKSGEIQNEKALGLWNKLSQEGLAKKTKDGFVSISIAEVKTEIPPVETKPVEETVVKPITEIPKTETVVPDPLKDVESTTRALWDIQQKKNIAESKTKLYDELVSEVDFNGNTYASSISEAYHKAKSDGTNPELVKAVEDLLGKKETKNVSLANEGSKTESLQVISNDIKDALGVSKEDAEVLIMIKESVFNDFEKKRLYRQYKNGALTLNDIKKYTVIDLTDLKTAAERGEINKWANAIINTQKMRSLEKNGKFNGEDVSFEEIPTETKPATPVVEKPTETPKETKPINENIDKFKEQISIGFEGIMDKIGATKNITSAERTTLITDLKNIANGFTGLAFEQMRTALYDIINKVKSKYRLKDKDVDEIVYGALEDFIVKDEATARDEVLKTLEDKYSNIEEKVFGTKTKTAKDFEGKTSIINKILASPQQAQEKTFAKLYDFVGDKLAKLLAKGMGNKYSLIRSATKTTDSLFKNIARQQKDVVRQADFIGQKNRAVEDTVKIDYLLKKTLGDTAKESSDRIIRVLDPDFYKKLSKEEFENEMRNEFDDKSVDYKLATEPDFIDRKYDEYLDEFGFNDHNYKDLTFDDLNPVEQGVYQILKEINSFLHDVNFAANKKIDYKTYLINKDKYFGRLYDRFEMPEDMQTELKSIGNKMFDDLYKERGDVTNWKRSHRIQDPIYTTTKRLYQTQMNRAFLDYADYITNTPEFLSDVPRAGYESLNGKAYGALNGKNVRSDIVEDIRGVFYTTDIIQKMHDLFSKYNQIAPRRWYRKLFTVYNPGVHVGNLTGNVVFASWLGINPVRFLKDFTLAGKEIKNYGDTYRYLIKRGVLSSDLTIEDLGNSLKKLNDLFDEASTKKNPLRWVSEKATTIYRATDDLAKVAAFKSLTDMGFSADTAIERISQGFQNYKRVGKAYDFFSKVPAVGNMYAKFGGDLQRILRTGIMTRPLNFVAFGAALHTIANVASSMSGESDEDRKIREERPGFPKIKLPDWLGGDIPLSFKMGENELNLARFISPLYVYSSPDNDDVYNSFMKLSPQKLDLASWTSNPNGITAVNIAKNLQDPLVAPILQTIVNSDFKGTPIADPKETNYKKSTLTDNERTVNSLRFLTRSYMPYGSYTDDALRAIAGQQDYYGRDRTLSQIILRFVGYNAQQFKEDRYSKVVENDLTNKAYRLVDNAKMLRSIEKDYVDKESTPEQYKKRYAEKIEQQAILMSELKDAIKKALPKLKKEGIDTLLEDKDFKEYFKQENGKEYKYQHKGEYRGKLPEDEKQPSQINEIK